MKQRVIPNYLVHCQKNENKGRMHLSGAYFSIFAGFFMLFKYYVIGYKD